MKPVVETFKQNAIFAPVRETGIQTANDSKYYVSVFFPYIIGQPMDY
jgi:hypothetical protein